MTSRKVQFPCTLPYVASVTDTLSRIAALFDTTVSELKKINRLMSDAIYPGQILFVPDKDYVSMGGGSAASSGASTPMSPMERRPIGGALPPSIPVEKKRHSSHESGGFSLSPPAHSVPGHIERHVMEEGWVSPPRPLSEEEVKRLDEECHERFVKLHVTYLTACQLEVPGVLLVTPDTVMFDPEETHPLVLERGAVEFSMTVTMDCVSSASVYHDANDMKRKRTEALESRRDGQHDNACPLSQPQSSLKSSTNQQSDADQSHTFIHSDQSQVSMPSLGAVELPNAGKMKDGSAAEAPIPSLGSSPASDSTEAMGLLTASDQEPAAFDETNTAALASGARLTEGDAQGDARAVRLVLQAVGDVLAGSSQNEEGASKLEPVKADSTGDNGARTNLIGNSSMPHNSRDEAQSAVMTGPTDKAAANALLELEWKEDYFPKVSGDFVASNKDVVSRGDGAEGERKRSISAEAGREMKVGVKAVKGSIASGEHRSKDAAGALGSREPVALLPVYLCLSVRLAVDPAKDYPVTLVSKSPIRPEYWYSIPYDKVDHLYAFLVQWTPNALDGSDDATAVEHGFIVIDCPADGGSDEKLNRRMSKDWEIVNIKEHKRRASQVELAKLPLPELSQPSAVFDDTHLRMLIQNLPARAEGCPWQLVYSSGTHGFSLKTLYRRMTGMDSPTVIIVRDNNQKIFGALLSCAVRLSEHFYGNGESYLFTFQPEFKKYAWTGINTFFIKGNVESLSIGASEGAYGLWFDSDLYHGRTQTCSTFENELLTASQDFIIECLEAWCFL